MSKAIRSAFRSLYDRMKSKPKNQQGLILGEGKTGLYFCHESGPVDPTPTLRLGLPTALKIFAGTKSGTVRDKKGQLIPKGLSFDGFKSPEEASQFLNLMLEDFQTFVDTIIKGDGTRFYSTWQNVTVVGNPPYNRSSNMSSTTSMRLVNGLSKKDQLISRATATIQTEEVGMAVFGSQTMVNEVKKVVEMHKGKSYRMVA